MKLKNKLKTVSFWVSLAAGVVLVVNSFGKQLGFNIQEETVLEIVSSICGLLVIFGLLSKTDQPDSDIKKMFDVKPDRDDITKNEDENK